LRKPLFQWETAAAMSQTRQSAEQNLVSLPQQCEFELADVARLGQGDELAASADFCKVAPAGGGSKASMPCGQRTKRVRALVLCLWQQSSRGARAVSITRLRRAP
jgi:hypothetical protein